MLNAIHNSEKFGSIQVDYKQSEITKNVYEVYGVRTNATDSGVCMAMSAKYLLKNSQNQDFFSWLADSSSKWEVASSYLDSDYSALAPIEVQDRIQDELKLHLNHLGTLNLKPNDFCSEGLSNAMSMVVNDDKDGFNMCYLYNPSGPGHAVACIKEQDCIKFMDPNFGEMSFNSSTEFENWMSNVFDKRYSYFSRLSVNMYESPSNIDNESRGAAESA
jgi:YopT-type cysteine protease-like protein